MPKPKAPKKKSAPKKNVTNPAGCSVGLPHVPAMYGLKPRKQYLPFSHAEERLTQSRNYWICTSRPDGRPHSIPVWGFWIDGAVYFGTARSSRKARNLAQNAAVSIHLDSGDDVVILEGTAVEVDLTDKPLFKKLDAASRAKYKMPLMVVPESVLYSVRPRVVLAWTEKDFPNNATRWQFDTASAERTRVPATQINALSIHRRMRRPLLLTAEFQYSGNNSSNRRRSLCDPVHSCSP